MRDKSLGDGGLGTAAWGRRRPTQSCVVPLPPTGFTVAKPVRVVSARFPLISAKVDGLPAAPGAA